ncbi:MAG: ecotin family protein [Cyanobium sp.]
MPSSSRLPGSAHRLLLPLALLGTLGATAVRAIPRLDLRPYPQAAAGEKRWVIQLPGLLPPTSDARISANPADWRVELLIGKELMVDCNGPRLSGRIRRNLLPAAGLPIYRVSEVSA